MVNVYLVMETPFVCWRSGLKAWQIILLRVDVVCASKQCNSAAAGS